MKAWLTILVVLFVAWLCGCSVPDEADMDELELRIASLNATAYRSAQEWVRDREIRDWLNYRNGNDTIGSIVCKQPKSVLPNEHLPASIHANYTAYDMWECMASRSYVECFDDWAQRMLAQVQKENPTFTDCKPQYTKQYHPDRVAQEALHKNESLIVGEYDFSPSRITTRDIAEAFVGSKTPPPLPGGWGAFRVLLPALCALGSGWGCPDHPSYPRDEPPQGDQ